MKISCCIFDLDGTLLTSDQHISDVDLRTLRDLSRKGIKIVIATGRSVHQIKEYIRELDIADPIITYNGSLISNPSTGEIIMKKTFSAEDVHTVETAMKEENFNYFFYTSNHIYYARDCDYSKYQQYYNTTVPEELRMPVFHISEMPEEEYSDVLVIAANNDASVIPKFRKKLSGKVDLNILDSGNKIIDILSADVSKGKAIRKLVSHFNIPLSETVAFGDSQNDETMFETVGFSVAMGNAYDSLKKKADFITKTNDEYGITHALNVLLNK